MSKSWLNVLFSRFKKKKAPKKGEEKLDELLEKRLSVCKEEDEGITIKVTDSSIHI